MTFLLLQENKAETIFTKNQGWKHFFNPMQRSEKLLSVGSVQNSMKNEQI